jgi:CubicO group peptidase (beta-lactamase class C family)
MNLTPTGEGYGGGGLYLRPRDLLKLGQTYLDSGVWQGHRVVSPAWVRQSTARQIVTGPESWDGYGWHLNILHAPGHDYQDYEATGNGGQLLIVVPDLDLAIVFTAANYNRYPIWRNFRDVITAREIIGSVSD